MSYYPIPIGTIAATPADSGTWLQMNGQVTSQSTYAVLFSVIGHQPQFAWTYSSGLPSAALIHMAFGNSVYVAVGSGGAICTSSNLSTWTSRTSGVATTLNSICWDSDNSLFVVVGASNVILTSPDGTTWTSRTSGVTSALANVIRANGETVAVGSTGWITHSTDNITWTATQPNSGLNNQYIVFTHGTWFTMPISNASGIVYSTDGSSWNYVAKPTTNGANLAGFDGTYFYLIDGSNAGLSTSAIYRSTNGASWALVTPTIFEYIPTTTTPSPVIFGSGTNTLIAATAGNLQFGYTTDGYATFHHATSQPANIAPGNIIANPLGNTAQHFAFFNFNSGVAVSVDGKSWFCISPSAVAGAATNAYQSCFVNGQYVFAFSLGSLAKWVSAPEPYNPSTQFQIPTNAPTGIALWIKAL